VVTTIFIVPAAYYLAYRRGDRGASAPQAAVA
jgi:hypothetical protein